MPDLSVRYIRQPDMVWRKISDEVMLVPIRAHVDEMESVFTLNETAALIWSLLDGRRSLADVRDAVLDEYEADPQLVERDLLELVEQWLEIQAIQPAA
jgi:hypothetical protein